MEKRFYMVAREVVLIENDIILKVGKGNDHGIVFNSSAVFSFGGVAVIMAVLHDSEFILCVCVVKVVFPVRVKLISLVPVAVVIMPVECGNVLNVYFYVDDCGHTRLDFGSLFESDKRVRRFCYTARIVRVVSVDLHNVFTRHSAFVGNFNGNGKLSVFGICVLLFAPVGEVRAYHFPLEVGVRQAVTERIYYSVFILIRTVIVKRFFRRFGLIETVAVVDAFLVFQAAYKTAVVIGIVAAVTSAVVVISVLGDKSFADRVSLVGIGCALFFGFRLNSAVAVVIPGGAGGKIPCPKVVGPARRIVVACDEIAESLERSYVGAVGTHINDRVHFVHCLEYARFHRGTAEYHRNNFIEIIRRILQKTFFVVRHLKRMFMYLRFIRLFVSKTFMRELGAVCILQRFAARELVVLEFFRHETAALSRL